MLNIRGMPIKVKCEIVVVGWMAPINCPPRVDFTTLPAPRCQLLGTKRPAIAPAEGLLTEAMLEHECVVRTTADDPRRSAPGKLAKDRSCKSSTG